MIYGLSKLDGVHPLLWAAVGYLGFRSTYDWKIVAGFRNSQEQAEAYAIGRTTQLGSTTVTDAPPGTSPHGYGLAVDVYPTTDAGKTIVLDERHPAFAEKARLLAGVPGVREISINSGKDWPHIEVRDWERLKNWKSEYAMIGCVVGVIACVALLSK